MGIFGKPNIRKLSAKRKTKALIKYINYTKDNDIRYDAIRALGDLNCKDAIEPIKKNLLVEKENHIRNISAKVLRTLGWTPEHDDKLAAIFWNGNEEYAKCAACGIYAIEPLIDRIINGNYKVIESFILIGQPALEYLLRYTDSIFDYYKKFTSGIRDLNFMQRDAQIQAKQIKKITESLGYCVYTIGEFNMPLGVKYLTSLYYFVKESIYSHSSGGFSDIYNAVSVRSHIVSAFKNTINSQGIEFLIEVLENEPSNMVRWEVVNCFEKIAEKSVNIIKNARIEKALNTELQRETDSYRITKIKRIFEKIK